MPSTSIERSAAASSSLLRSQRSRHCSIAALGILERLLRATLLRMRLFEAGAELAQHLLELRKLDLILLDVGIDLGDLRVGVLQILGLPLDQLLAVLYRLLEARDLRADAVVVALHGIEALAAVRKLHSQLLDRGLGRALRRDRSLERELALGELRALGRRLRPRTPVSRSASSSASTRRCSDFSVL